MSRRSYGFFLSLAALCSASAGGGDDEQFANLRGITEVSVTAEFGPHSVHLFKPNELRGQAVSVLSTKLKINPDPNFLPRVRVLAEATPGHSDNGCSLNLIVVKTVLEDQATSRGRELVLPLWQRAQAKCHGKCDVKASMLHEIESQAEELLNDWLKAEAKEPEPKSEKLPPPPEAKKI
jgi:hypothetical protein